MSIIILIGTLFLEGLKTDTRETMLELLINNIIKIFFSSCIALLIGLESYFILILLIYNSRGSNELGNIEIKKIKSF